EGVLIDINDPLNGKLDFLASKEEDNFEPFYSKMNFPESELAVVWGDFQKEITKINHKEMLKLNEQLFEIVKPLKLEGYLQYENGTIAPNPVFMDHDVANNPVVTIGNFSILTTLYGLR